MKQELQNLEDDTANKYITNSSSMSLMSFYISGLLGCLLVQLILVNEIKFLAHWFVILPILISPFIIPHYLSEECKQQWIIVSRASLLKLIPNKNREKLGEYEEKRQKTLEYEETHPLYRYTMFLLIFLLVVSLLWITNFGIHNIPK